MDAISAADVSSELGRAERALRGLLDGLLDPWVVTQLLLIVLLFVVGRALGRAAETALEPRVRAIRGKPKLLRFVALLLRRTSSIAVALILTVAVVAIRAFDRPAHAVLIATAAGLVAAWVAISVTSRLVRNRSLARLVAWIAWILVAFWITGSLDDVSHALDALAIRVGALRISLYDVIQATLVVAVVLWAAIVAGNLMERRIAANADLTPSLKVLIGKLVKIALLIAAVGVALAALGIDLTALTVFSGAVGVGVGFGLRKVVSNFVSGVIILLDKSIKPGDTISLGETFGWVRSLRARFVSVITRDGREYLIPNEDFVTQRVENWSFTDTLVRVDVEFGVSYDSDPHQVRRVAVEAARAVDRVEPRPQPVCHLTAFGASSLDFILRFWIADPQNGMTNVRGAVLLACWDAFKASGIAIPYPRQEIEVRGPVEVKVVLDEAPAR